MKKPILLALIALTFGCSKKQTPIPPVIPALSIVGNWTEWEDLFLNPPPNTSNEGTSPFTNGFTQTYSFSTNGQVTKSEFENQNPSNVFTEYAGTYTVKYDTTNSQTQILFYLNINKVQDNGIWDVEYPGGVYTLINKKDTLGVNEKWTLYVTSDTSSSFNADRIGYLTYNGKYYSGRFLEDYKRSQ
jgi:hypothetical protein